MAYVSLATRFTPINLTTPSTSLDLTGVNGANAVVFMLTGAATGVKFTETSSVDPLLDGEIPVDRLVFDNELVESGVITLDELNNSFSTTKAVMVGYFGSAVHDGIECSSACWALLDGRDDPRGQ